MASGAATSSNTIAFAVTFTEDVPALQATGITVTNGTVSGFDYSTLYTQYVFNILPSASGAVTLLIVTGAFEDDHGNANTAAIVYDFFYAPITQ